MAKSIGQEAELRPLRAGVFSQWRAANQAVQRLLAAGFTKEQVTVVCSDAAKERHFREFEHQQPAGANTPMAATTGGALGAALGGRRPWPPELQRVGCRWRLWGVRVC